MQPEIQQRQTQISDRLIILDWLLIFVRKLDVLTPYNILRRLGVITTYRHVEIWIIMWIAVVAATTYFISNHLISPTLVVILCGFGGIRVIEIVLAQCKTIFLIEDGSGRSPHSIYSLRRSLVLGMVNFGEIVAWFTIYHLVLLDNNFILIQGNQSGTFLLLLRESLIEMVGNSSGLVTAVSTAGWILFVIQPIIGFFMVSVVLGRFISFLPKPVTADQEEVELGDKE